MLRLGSRRLGRGGWVWAGRLLRSVLSSLGIDPKPCVPGRRDRAGGAAGCGTAKTPPRRRQDGPVAASCQAAAARSSICLFPFSADARARGTRASTSATLSPGAQASRVSQGAPATPSTHMVTDQTREVEGSKPWTREVAASKAEGCRLSQEKGRLPGRASKRLSPRRRPTHRRRRARRGARPR